LDSSGLVRCVTPVGSSVHAYSGSSPQPSGGPRLSSFGPLRGAVMWGGRRGMAGRRGQDKIGNSSGRPFHFLPSLAAALLAGTSQAALADTATLRERVVAAIGNLPVFDLHNAVYFAVFMGLL